MAIQDSPALAGSGIRRLARPMLGCSGAMLRRRTLALAFAALLGLPLAVGGCASPTLPLPPPETPTITIGEGGLVTLNGNAIPNSIVYGLNQQAEQGVIVKAGGNGAYTMSLKANLGDFVSIWQEVGVDRSPSILLQIVPPKK